MSTPTVPTKPDSPPVRAQQQRPPAAEVLPPADDRAVDADLLLDIPHLTVEELALELDASLLLERVKVEAKGLEAHAPDAGERARHAVAQGVKAAGLTAAGLAGGALLESRTKPSRRLHIPRRRSRARFLREIAKRLP